MEHELSDEERANLRVMTISIDPERDTPGKLQETMERHSVDASRWSMVRSNPGDLRMIAGVFGVKYKQLPDGEFNHTTRIILLDGEGTQVANTEQLGRYDAAFLEAIKTSLQWLWNGAINNSVVRHEVAFMNVSSYQVGTGQEKRIFIGYGI